jgi:hypothetical protein
MTMDLDHLLRSGALMKTIDVLCDEAIQVAGFLELSQGDMGGIRLRLHHQAGHWTQLHCLPSG